jgi:hypothetical protein
MTPAAPSPFLDIPEAEWVCANDLCFAIFDSYPVSPGHVLVIPRYAGDMGDPRGGVRHVIPEKGNYFAGPPAGGEGDLRLSLTTGPDRRIARSTALPQRSSG